MPAGCNRPAGVIGGKILLGLSVPEKHAAHIPRSTTLASHTASSLSVFGRPGTFFTCRAFNSQHSNHSARVDTTAARPGWIEVTGGFAHRGCPPDVGVWLSSGMRPAGHRGAKWLKRGLFNS